MQKLCPTCCGKGSIDDPKAPPVLCYCGPNGERCPQVLCMSCGGSGWVSVHNDGVKEMFAPCPDCNRDSNINISSYNVSC